MADQDSVTIARNLFETWNGHDPDAYASLLTSDFVSESDTMPAPQRGVAAAQKTMRMYLAAFPDLRFTVEAAFASNEATATVRWRASGTHRAEVLGVGPTQRRMEIRGCSILQMRDGKVAHQWIYWDTGHLLRQLGALPERTMTAGR
jgi:steroid delta-isomerase-like uncharacterized protein